MFVIVRNQMDCENEVLAVRKTRKRAKIRIAKIAEQMAKESQDTEPLDLTTNEDGSEVYLTRAEFENEDPHYVLTFIQVDDVDA